MRRFSTPVHPAGRPIRIEALSRPSSLSSRHLGGGSIVTPTSPTVAFPIGDKAADPLAMYACDLLTIPSCLAGLPGLSIPCGLSEGLPVGLQIIGTQFGENGLFRIGHALEHAIQFDVVPERLR